MKQIYFLFVVLLVVMTACGGKKEASVDAEQLMFQIDNVDHVTGLQRMQVSRIEQDIRCIYRCIIIIFRVNHYSHFLSQTFLKNTQMRSSLMFCN